MFWCKQLDDALTSECVGSKLNRGEQQLVVDVWLSQQYFIRAAWALMSQSIIHPPLPLTTAAAPEMNWQTAEFCPHQAHTFGPSAHSHQQARRLYESTLLKGRSTSTSANAQRAHVVVPVAFPHRLELESGGQGALCELCRSAKN